MQQGRRLLKSTLSEKQWNYLRKLRAKGANVAGAAIATDLSALARLHHCDKFGSHFYTPHYQQHFSPWRERPLNILEIGIGGYDDPQQGGASLRMWKSFFPRANIFGIDIHDKSPHDEARIKTFKGSQIDEAFLREVVGSTGPLKLTEFWAVVPGAEVEGAMSVPSCRT